MSSHNAHTNTFRNTAAYVERDPLLRFFAARRGRKGARKRVLGKVLVKYFLKVFLYIYALIYLYELIYLYYKNV